MCVCVSWLPQRQAEPSWDEMSRDKPRKGRDRTSLEPSRADNRRVATTRTRVNKAHTRPGRSYGRPLVALRAPPPPCARCAIASLRSGRRTRSVTQAGARWHTNIGSRARAIGVRESPRESRNIPGRSERDLIGGSETVGWPQPATNAIGANRRTDGYIDDPSRVDPIPGSPVIELS